MIKACVIGWPISHSRSPLIHGYWLKQLGIDGSYTRQPVQPEALPQFISNLAAEGYSGCNVTLPHKEAVFRLVTPAEEWIGRLGAVNTVYHGNGRLLGTNTDGEGFINSVRSQAPGLAVRDSQVVIIGAGGAAIAIINALLLEGAAKILVVNRSIEKAELLRQKFGERLVPVEWQRRNEVLDDCDLLVNATALGMTGQPALDISLQRLRPEAVVADIVYTPLRTPLLEAAQERGLVIVPGLGMLLHQAVRGFELWFGKRPVVTDELYDIVARDIDAAYQR